MSEALSAFEALNRYQLKGFGLTPAQFDIIATLGNTNGMTFGELGRKTLITKGTLTGVIDRLSRMGLVARQAGQPDRRTVVVALTSEGLSMFEAAYPALLYDTQRLFSDQGYTDSDFGALNDAFERLRNTFIKGHGPIAAIPNQAGVTDNRTGAEPSDK